MIIARIRPPFRSRSLKWLTVFFMPCCVPSMPWCDSHAAEIRPSTPAVMSSKALPPIAESVVRGRAFLTNLFDASVDLLPEFRGSHTYWLFHDNYLAAHALAATRPDLSQRIRSALGRFGITNSGKIEIVFDEAPRPLPFRAYHLTDVATVDGRKIRTEVVTTNIMQGWESYADLLLLASIAQSRGAPGEARRNFDRATAMWDGRGFQDPATRRHGIYATYKLALYLIAADRLALSPPLATDVLAQLRALQASDGGWRTDYNAAGPQGLTNVETTCLALRALETFQRPR